MYACFKDLVFLSIANGLHELQSKFEAFRRTSNEVCFIQKLAIAPINAGNHLALDEVLARLQPFPLEQYSTFVCRAATLEKKKDPHEAPRPVKI